MPLTGSRRSPPAPSSSTVRAVLFDQHHIPQLAGASHPTVQDSQAQHLCSWPREQQGKQGQRHEIDAVPDEIGLWQLLNKDTGHFVSPHLHVDYDS